METTIRTTHPPARRARISEPVARLRPIHEDTWSSDEDQHRVENQEEDVEEEDAQEEDEENEGEGNEGEEEEEEFANVEADDLGVQDDEEGDAEINANVHDLTEERHCNSNTRGQRTQRQVQDDDSDSSSEQDGREANSIMGESGHDNSDGDQRVSGDEDANDNSLTDDDDGDASSADSGNEESEESGVEASDDESSTSTIDDALSIDSAYDESEDSSQTSMSILTAIAESTSEHATKWPICNMADLRARALMEVEGSKIVDIPIFQTILGRCSDYQVLEGVRSCLFQEKERPSGTYFVLRDEMLIQRWDLRRKGAFQEVLLALNTGMAGGTAQDFVIWTRLDKMLEDKESTRLRHLFTSSLSCYAGHEVVSVLEDMKFVQLEISELEWTKMGHDALKEIHETEPALYHRWKRSMLRNIREKASHMRR